MKKRDLVFLKFLFVEDEEGEVFEDILVGCGHEYFVIRLGELDGEAVDSPTNDNCNDKRIRGVPPDLFELHGEGEIFGEFMGNGDFGKSIIIVSELNLLDIYICGEG